MNTDTGILYDLAPRRPGESIFDTARRQRQAESAMNAALRRGENVVAISDSAARRVRAGEAARRKRKAARAARKRNRGG